MLSGLPASSCSPLAQCWCFYAVLHQSHAVRWLRCSLSTSPSPLHLATPVLPQPPSQHTSSPKDMNTCHSYFRNSGGWLTAIAKYSKCLRSTLLSCRFLAMQCTSKVLQVLVSHRLLSLLLCPESSLVSPNTTPSIQGMTRTFPLLFYTKQFLFLLFSSNSFWFWILRTRAHLFQIKGTKQNPFRNFPRPKSSSPLPHKKKW